MGSYERRRVTSWLVLSVLERAPFKRFPLRNKSFLSQNHPSSFSVSVLCCDCFHIVRQNETKPIHLFLNALPTFSIHRDSCGCKNIFFFLSIVFVFQDKFQNSRLLFPFRRYQDTKLPCQISHPLPLLCDKPDFLFVTIYT